MRAWMLSLIWLPQLFAVTVSDADDRLSIKMTLYDRGRSLVQEERRLDLSYGEQEVDVRGLPRTVDPQSLRVRGSGLDVLSQSHRSSALSRDALLRHYVGKPITLSVWNPYQERTYEESAILASLQGGPAYLINGEVHLDHPGRPVLPAVPEGWTSNDQFLWRLRANRSNPIAEMTYFVSGLSWSPSYVLEVDSSEARGDLSGEAVMENRTGADFDDADVRLVAGDVQQEPPVLYMEAAAAPMARSRSMDMPDPQALSEYYAYELREPINLADGSVQRVPLLEDSAFSIRKELLVRGRGASYAGRWRQSQPIPAELHYHFKAPAVMPAGLVRVFHRDDGGRLTWLGEQRVAHTPKEQEVDLLVGRAMDVHVERTQTDYQRITNKRHSSSWELLLTNRKDEPVQVAVEESLVGDWKITDSNYPFEKVDASTVRWTIDVEKRPRKIEYSVEVDY